MFRSKACALLVSTIVVVTGGHLNAQDLNVPSLVSEAVIPHETGTPPIYGDHVAETSITCNQPACTACVSNQCVGQEYFQSPDEASRNPWFVRMGVGVLLFGDSATLRINDAVVPGAGIEISDVTTFAFDIGYQLSPQWSVTFSGGVPPTLDLNGTGIFAGASYGTTKFAPIALTVQRYFRVTQKTSIYVGGGINYNFQYESKDGLIQNLDIENGAAGVVQLGAERRINNRISLYADAKKAFYKTEAFGNSGPAAIQSDVTVNPTILAFGLRYNF